MKRVRFRKESGELIGKHNIRTAMDSLKDGEYAMELKVWSGEKTWEQIKTIHGVLIPEISNHTGYTIKEVKRYLKIDYGEIEYFDKDGETWVEIKSYADYTKSQMRQHIDKVLNHCEHDLGIIIDIDTRNKLTQ